MSRPFDFSQLPAGGVTVLPALPPNPTPGDALIVDTVAPDGRVQLVFARGGGGTGGGGTTTVTISDTPPLNPLPGALWFDSVEARLFLRYADASSSQWVVANSVGPAAGGGTGGGTAGVASFNTRTGVVTLSNADVIAVLPSATASPAMDGVASAGTGTTWSRQDHVHPTDTTRAAVNSQIFTGTPSLPTGTIAVTQAPATANTSLATTAFVTTAVGAVQAGAVIADTPPVLNPGGLWWDSTGGQLYVRYNDGNSTAYVAATNIQGLANAATKAEVNAALQNSGRNLLHNAMFNVMQRGAGPFSGNVYTLDRWSMQAAGGTFTTASAALSDANRTSIGDEAARYCFNTSTAGQSTTADYAFISQSMENVSRLAGKTVIVSFYANAASSSVKVGVSLDQIFGSGGSPSAQVSGNGQAVTLSAIAAEWGRYSLAFVVPSVIGKTIGTNGDSNTRVNLWVSAGSAIAARSGGIGIQSGVINFWGVQLEVAAAGQTQPSPLDKPDPQQDLANCQRFYQLYIAGARATVTGITSVGSSCSWPQMRATPTATRTSAGFSALAGAATLTPGYPMGGFYGFPSTGAGDSYTLNEGYGLSADL